MYSRKKKSCILEFLTKRFNPLSILKYICYSFKNSMFFTFTLKFSIKINFQFKNFSRLNFCVLCVQVCNSLDNMCAMKQNSLFRKILVSILYIYIFLKKCRSEIEFSKKVHDLNSCFRYHDEFLWFGYRKDVEGFTGKAIFSWLSSFLLFDQSFEYCIVAKNTIHNIKRCVLFGE